MDVKYGKDYKHLNKGKYPVLGTGGIMEYVDEFLYSGESILIGRKGTIDKPKYINDSFWTVDTLFYTEIKKQFPKFLFYCISNINWLKYNEASGVPSLSANNIKNVKINIPELIEQKKIANFLTSIDYKIELLDAKHKYYVEFKRYLMQQIFTQKLRFAEFEDEWIPYKIGDISETYSGGTPSTSKKEYYEGNIPFIKSGEINNNVTEQYITEDALKNSSAKKVQKGDLLLALYGATSGEVAISKIDGAINQAVLKIDNNMDNYFQYCYFLMYKDQIVHKYIQGGQGNLSANIIKKLEFKYPSLAEQKKISQFFMSFDNKLELYENKIIKYNNLKKGLLQQMFDYVHIILNFPAKICCIKYFLNS